MNMTLNGSCDGVGLSVRIEYDDNDDPTYPITYVIDSEDGLVIGYEEGGCPITCKQASDAIRGLIESGDIGARSPVTLKLLGEDYYVPNWGGIEDSGDGPLVLPVPDGWEPDGRSYGVPFNYANEDVSVLEEDVLYAIYKFVLIPYFGRHPNEDMCMVDGWECGNTLNPDDVAEQYRKVPVPEDEEIVMLDVIGWITICHSGVYLQRNGLFPKVRYYPWNSHPEITQLNHGNIWIDGFMLNPGFLSNMGFVPMLQYLFDRCD